MPSLISLMVLLSLLFSGMHTAAAAPAREQNLLLFYSNDVLGETEPCG